MSKKLTKEMLYALEMEQKMAVDSYQASTTDVKRCIHLDDITQIGKVRRDLAEIQVLRTATILFRCLCFAAVCVGLLSLAVTFWLWF